MSNRIAMLEGFGFPSSLRHRMNRRRFRDLGVKRRGAKSGPQQKKMKKCSQKWNAMSAKKKRGKKFTTFMSGCLRKGK